MAHMIVGTKPEAYLAASLESIADGCAHAVVNDTSGLSGGPNAAILEESRLAREGRLTLIRSSFTDFASARNACIDATPEAFRSGFGLIVDADEVHGPGLASMAAVASRVPSEVDAIDGYERHFVGSFAWWFQLNRTRCLFRLSPLRRWENPVHERLAHIGRRIALPVVWFHYGHVVTPREEAEKGRLYASLGQLDPAPTDRQLERARPATVWPNLLRKAVRFQGWHPAPMQQTIEQLTAQRQALFDEVDALVAEQTRLQRFRNRARVINYQRLLLWRSLQARVQWGWRPQTAPTGVDVQESIRAAT